jgi:hypothetical protein
MIHNSTIIALLIAKRCTLLSECTSSIFCTRTKPLASCLPQCLHETDDRRRCSSSKMPMRTKEQPTCSVIAESLQNLWITYTRHSPAQPLMFATPAHTSPISVGLHTIHAGIPLSLISYVHMHLGTLPEHFSSSSMTNSTALFLTIRDTLKCCPLQ